MERLNLIAFVLTQVCSSCAVPLGDEDVPATATAPLYHLRWCTSELNSPVMLAKRPVVNGVPQRNTTEPGEQPHGRGVE